MNPTAVTRAIRTGGDPPVRAGWLTGLLLAGIRFYQGALAPMNPWGCKFYPSCSHYALEAIVTRGLAGGLGLAARRLVRCRPGTRGGFDPVPAGEEEAGRTPSER